MLLGEIVSFCQQPLGQKVGDRLKSFEDFVTGTLQKKADEAAETLRLAIESVSALRVTNSDDEAFFEEIEADPEEARPWFRKLRTIRDDLEREGIEVPGLSMGMSNDFEIAIEEGATIVRIGTTIFGPRL